MFLRVKQKSTPKRLQQLTPETTPSPKIIVGYNGLAERLNKTKFAAFDFETTGLEWWDPEQKRKWVAFSCGGIVNVIKQPPNSLELEEFLWPYLTNKEFKLIGHNIKFDLHWLDFSTDLIQCQLIDTMTGAHLLDENRSNSLKSLIKSVFRITLPTYRDTVGTITEEIADERTKKGTRKRTRLQRIDELPDDKVIKYVASDAYWTEKLYVEYIKPQLNRWPKLQRNFEDIQVPLTKVLLAIEQRGIEVDVNKAKELLQSYRTESLEIEHKLNNLLTHLKLRDVINYNSPKQLDKLLYKTLSYPRPPFRIRTKNKDGYKVESKYHTNELCLVWLGVEHDCKIAQLCLKRRKLVKWCGYLESIVTKNVNKRMHTNFNQTGARTGRLSSSGSINLQNIPSEKEFRSIFRAREDHVLLRADLSQAELRLLAHFSQDKSLISSYHNSDTDLHRDTANAIGLIKLLGYDDGRFAGKTANFSMAYGVWADTFRFTLYRTTDGRIKLSRNQAIEALKELNENRYRGVTKWKKQVLKAGRRASGTFETIEGRKRRLPGLLSPDWGEKGYAERQGINSIVQGSVGDIINRIMTTWLGKECLEYAVLQVHDEIVWEIPNTADLSLKLATLEAKIEEFYGLTVPIQIDYNEGKVWSK